jgi:hypothetical protein
MVIIHRETLKQKIDNFIQENQIMQLTKDPIDSFQEQIQQTIHKCKAIDKNTCCKSNTWHQNLIP